MPHRRTSSAPDSKLPLSKQRSMPQQMLPPQPSSKPWLPNREPCNAGLAQAEMPSTSLRWHKSSISAFQTGRVLIIDYTYNNGGAGRDRVRVAYQEIDSESALQRFFQQDRHVSFRLIHVQNSEWAVQVLRRYFKIDTHDALTGAGFSEWSAFENASGKEAKMPLLKARTWQPQRDPWRSIRRTAFSFDYLRPYHVRSEDRPWKDEHGQLTSAKLMELLSFDENNIPVYAYDVLVQRISAYIQWADGSAMQPPDDTLSPYEQVKGDNALQSIVASANGHEEHSNQLPPVNAFENTNAVIIFEHSAKDGDVADTLLSARQQTECRWRRLNYLFKVNAEDQMAVECINGVLQDVFKACAASWDDTLSVIETHVTILEGRIYGNPADESRSHELWDDSQAWLKLEKLAALHNTLAFETITRLEEVIPLSPSSGLWLDGIGDRFGKIRDMIRETVVKRSANLLDLMHKSITIRDSRRSLELGMSMWRLSWITFVFLPLTFTVGFFGMNKDVFHGDPSIRWFFAAVVPFMLLVFLVWYFFKHARIATEDAWALQNRLFEGLSAKRPDLWTLKGPRRHVKPQGCLNCWRWRLLLHWFSPHARSRHLRMFPRWKLLLTRRWIGGISLAPKSSDIESSAQTVPIRVANVITPNIISPYAHKSYPKSTAVHNIVEKNASVTSDYVQASSSGGSSSYIVEEFDCKDDGPTGRQAWQWGRGMRKSIDSTLMETLQPPRV